MDVILSYPPSYGIAILVALLLGLETALHFDAPWRMPYAAVLGTVCAWYLIEPIYDQAVFSLFDSKDISDAFISVIVFLCALRLFAPVFAPQAGLFSQSSRASSIRISPQIARKMFFATIILWAIMVLIGVWRSGGQVWGALFPNGRTESTAMWARNGVSTGLDDTLAGVAGYIYIIVLANFGVMLTFVNGARLRGLCILLIMVSWPYGFLIGARTIALAVFMPGFLAFLVYGRTSRITKLVVTIIMFSAINVIFKIIIAYRNIGFDNIGDFDLENVHHEGLNMASELVYIIGFLRSHVLNLQWGYGYLADLSQLIPRSLWPDKPGIEFDYAFARGFGSHADANAVLVTITQGMIGQGVRQFGYIGGAIVAAGIMAIWIRILTNLRLSRKISRACLFLLGLGLTFNLGRDVSLLVLWPFVMAYAMVYGYDLISRRRNLGVPATRRMSI